MATEPATLGAPAEQTQPVNHSPANSSSANPPTAAPQPKKRRGFWRGFGLTLLLLAISVGLYATQTQHGKDTVIAVQQAGQMLLTVKTNPDLIFQQANGDHVNILLIGRDVNWKETKVYDPTTKTYRRFHVHDKNSKARSDTMIVVSLDKSRNTIRMVSLPRDARVYIPHNDVSTGVDKLNAAHAFGGPQLLMKTLSDEMGITIHHYAVIKFEGFKKLIDQVGGITVNVDGALKKDHQTGKLYRGNLDYDDDYGNLHIHLKPGVQQLDGEKAHNYVRFRMDYEGDPGRIRRQQAVMRALAKAVMQASPLAVPGLVKEVRRQFETDLKDDTIASAAYFAKGIGDAGKIQPLTLFGTYTTRGSVLLNKPKNEALLKTIFGPTFNSEKFLHRSPSIESGDEIGASNNSTPASRAVLREAGLLKDAQAPRPSEMDAPLRVEPSRQDENGSEAGRKISRSSDRRRSRYAALSDTSDSRRGSSSRDEANEERPRRRRRRSRHHSTSDTASTSSRRESRSAARDSSPIPVPDNGAGSSDAASPVPQPE